MSNISAITTFHIAYDMSNFYNNRLFDSTNDNFCFMHELDWVVGLGSYFDMFVIA